MIELIEGNSHEFFGVPFRIYPKESPYVSPLKDDLVRSLDSRQNPLFLNHGEGSFFTVRRKGIPVGRISAHIHTASNERHGKTQCYFGFFDCADDPEAAKMLLDTAETFGRKRGMTEIIGNFNLTAMQMMGVVTDGFEHAPYTDQVYNPPHIPKLLEANGYERTFPATTFEVDITSLDPETLIPEDAHARLKEAGLEWRQLQKKGFKQLMRDTCDVLNAGFHANPMFVPLSHEEFLFQAQDMMWIIDPRISSIVYKDDQPVAVTVCIPDLNPLLKRTRSRLGLTTPWHYMRHRMNRKRAIVIFSSVVPELHGQGVAPSMLYRMIRSLKEAGYEKMGITWVGDVNKASLRVVEKTGGTPLHRVHLFRKDLA